MREHDATAAELATLLDPLEEAAVMSGWCMVVAVVPTGPRAHLAWVALGPRPDVEPLLAHVARTDPTLTVKWIVCDGVSIRDATDA
jgi:hypothetical protein